MKNIFIYLMLFFLLDSCTLLADDSSNFRNCKWGMNKQKVIAAEKNKITSQSEDSIILKDEIVGIEVTVAYGFTFGQLTSGHYVFETYHSNLNDIISDYNSLVSLLTEKYGTPQSNVTDWIKIWYKPFPSRHGEAVAKGHLEYHAVWPSDQSTIILWLAQKGDFGQNLQLDYRCKKEFKSKIEQKNTKIDVKTKL